MTRPAGDFTLVHIVDAAFAESARKSGNWLLCRPGCTQCCHGVFAISQLDVERLTDGLAQLQTVDPERASRVRARSKAAIAQLAADFPGDLATGLLDESPEAMERFEGFANEEPCPLLDPATGTCDLYEFRPMTCRVFGPPIASEGGLGVCDLCYHGASAQEIADCEVVPDPEDLESEVLQEVEETTGRTGSTIVAFAIAGTFE